MRVALPYLMQDLSVPRDDPEIPPLLTYTVESPEFFDGPATRRIAVVDLDERTGRLRRPVKLVLPTAEGMALRYDLPPTLTDIQSSERSLRKAEDLIKVAAFTTALQTLDFFERALDRTVSWAFPSSQLLLVPRAGTLDNAFYERESGSIQFYSFVERHKREIHTALSRDIVAHETTHAILDGLLPDLYDAHSPHCLAIHEAVADLVATALIIESEGELYFLAGRGTEFRDEPLAVIAEEVGRAVSDQRGERRPQQEEDRPHGLRSLINRRTLKPSNRTRDDQGQPNRVDVTDPHALSTVLSGAIFSAYQYAARRIFVRYTRRRRHDEEKAELAVRAYRDASPSLIRCVIGSLQLLPPGELSLLDFARAVNLAAHPELDSDARTSLRKEFLRRGITSSAEFEWRRGRRIRGLTRTGLDVLLKRAPAARAFVGRHRSVFGIPEHVRFQLLPPRVISERAARDGAFFKPYRVALRVRWSEDEEYDLPRGHPRLWRIRRGATLVIDSETRRVHLLASDRGEQQREDRQAYLRRLANDGILVPERHAVRPDGRVRSDVLVPGRAGRAAQLTGAGRMLHLMGFS